MFKRVMPSDSKGARKRSAYAFAKDARAVQVWPDPAHHLQTKITYRVLPQFLLEDHVLDALPWFEQPAVLGFPSNSPAVRCSFQ